MILQVTGPSPTFALFLTVLEKLAIARMRPHVLSTGNLSCLQSAYRPGYSTESALLKVVGDIECAAGRDLCTVLLALDSLFLPPLTMSIITSYASVSNLTLD